MIQGYGVFLGVNRMNSTGIFETLDQIHFILFIYGIEMCRYSFNIWKFLLKKFGRRNVLD